MDVPMQDTVPDAPRPFVVRDGNLVSLGEPRGHLVTKASYQNYRLEVEYSFTGAPGNCGVLVHASTPRALYKMFPKSIEVQMEHQNAGDFWVIVEDIEVENMVERRGPENLWGITEGKNRRRVDASTGSPTNDASNCFIVVIGRHPGSHFVPGPHRPFDSFGRPDYVYRDVLQSGVPGGHRRLSSPRNGNATHGDRWIFPGRHELAELDPR